MSYAGKMAVREPAAARARAVAVASPPRPLADRVLALQQSAGNGKVKELLRDQRRPRPRASIRLLPIRGGLAPWKRRSSTELLKEDVLVIRATVADVSNPQSVKPYITILPAAMVTVEDERWRDRNTYEWRIRATSIGTFRLGVAMVGSGVEKRIERTVIVASDAGDQRSAMEGAQNALDGRFSGVLGRLAEAAAAFNTAYRLHEAELKNVESSERLTKEMLWGIVFAGMGGFAGGAVGGYVKHGIEARLRPLLADEGRTRVLTEGLTDLLKDMTKYGVRSSGKQVPSIAGDSTAPAGTRHHATSDSRKPIDDDPLSFYLNLTAELQYEKQRIHDELAVVNAHVRTEAGRSPRALFYQDPIALVREPDDLLDTIARRLDTNWKHYYEQLWGKWVEAYYYRVRPSNAFEQLELGADFYVVERADGSWITGWALARALRNVIKTLGKTEYPDVRAFLNKYGNLQAKIDTVSPPRPQRRPRR